jgi:hypothetical protein
LKYCFVCPCVLFAWVCSHRFRSPKKNNRSIIQGSWPDQRELSCPTPTQSMLREVLGCNTCRERHKAVLVTALARMQLQQYWHLVPIGLQVIQHILMAVLQRDVANPKLHNNGRTCRNKKKATITTTTITTTMAQRRRMENYGTKAKRWKSCTTCETTEAHRKNSKTESQRKDSMHATDRMLHASMDLTSRYALQR